MYNVLKNSTFTVTLINMDRYIIYVIIVFLSVSTTLTYGCDHLDSPTKTLQPAYVIRTPHSAYIPRLFENCSPFQQSTENTFNKCFWFCQLNQDCVGFLVEAMESICWTCVIDDVGSSPQESIRVDAITQQRYFVSLDYLHFLFVNATGY